MRKTKAFSFISSKCWSHGTAERIKSKGMRVVGWYHSHPLFQPDPSVRFVRSRCWLLLKRNAKALMLLFFQRDIQSQKSYQQLFKDEDNGANCFVGAIDATYDSRIPTLESIFTWFSSGKHPELYIFQMSQPVDLPNCTFANKARRTERTFLSTSRTR